MKINKVLVCGGRKFKEKKLLYSVLDKINDEQSIDLIVQGWAMGADRLAHQWACDNGINSTHRKYEVTQLDWMQHGKSAGYIRNQRMLDNEKPNLVVAFKGENGTQMMVKIAKRSGLKPLKIDW